MATAETIPSWAVWVPVVSAGIGGIIAVIGSTINNYINKKAEEKKQIREVIIKTAIESWREDYTLTKSRGGVMLPIDSYIVHMAILSDALLDPECLTEEQLLVKLRKSDKLIKAQIKFDEERKQQRNESPNQANPADAKKRRG